MKKKYNCKTCPLSKSPADCIIPFLSRKKYNSVEELIKDISSKKFYQLFKKLRNTNDKN